MKDSRTLNVCVVAVSEWFAKLSKYAAQQMFPFVILKGKKLIYFYFVLVEHLQIIFVHFFSF